MTDLNAAFALSSPEDCARLYADWAASYDTGFAAGLDYRLPAHVAAAFLAHGGKGLYRSLFQADITRPLSLGGPYHGIVSSGTFTHGHVGPAAISQLETQAAPGALFALSINEGVYRAMGFDAALAQRPGVTLLEVQIYGPVAARGVSRAPAQYQPCAS